MNAVHFAYNFLVTVGSLIALPALWSRERQDPHRKNAFLQRLGYDAQPSDPPLRGRPRIWIHAVSVGEVKVAEAIVNRLEGLCPALSVVLTTTTPTGQRYARKQFDGRATVRYAPLDLWGAIGRFLVLHRPDVLVCLETEIWPNWIARAHGAGVKTVFLNGRISTRSIRSYLHIRFLIKPVLEMVDAFSMIADADARRIISLGAPAERVRVNGNAKMDAWQGETNGVDPAAVKRLFAVNDRTAVFIAGSIRGAEADMMMTIYARLADKIPDLLFIIAPRHIDKSAQIATLARARGIVWQYRTDLGKKGVHRRAPLVILDTIGELRWIYQIAAVVFCGGSLVPLGGQDVLEAAALAKPVLFGPFMDDFAEARMLLESSGGGVCVNDEEELADWAFHLLRHPDEARRMGRLAKQAVEASGGATLRHARVVADLLSPINS